MAVVSCCIHLFMLSLRESNFFHGFKYIKKYIKIKNCSDILTSIYDKRDDYGCPIVNFPWFSGDVPRRYDIYSSRFIRFARCCTGVLDLQSKNLYITSKILTQSNRYHKLRNKNILKVLQVILRAFVENWWNVVSRICFRRNLSPGFLMVI